jgi:3-hydroxyacyl-[acyl-carrier-protein] dehydratase
LRFFLIDRITAWEPGAHGCAVKSISLSEDFFDDHFPLNPIMPGVLILEGMAQLSGLLLEEGIRAQEGLNLKALMSIVEKAKFRHPAYPGDVLEYRADVTSLNEQGGKAAATAQANGNLIAEATLVFSFHAIENPKLEEWRADVMEMWMRDLRNHDGQ